jgi:hypothetical protein
MFVTKCYTGYRNWTDALIVFSGRVQTPYSESPTSQKTRRVSVTKLSRLMTFKGIIKLHSVNETDPTKTDRRLLLSVISASNSGVPVFISRPGRKIFRLKLVFFFKYLNENG